RFCGSSSSRRPMSTIRRRWRPTIPTCAWSPTARALLRRFCRVLPGAEMATISFENVSKVYPDGTTAVRGLDLDVEDGEFMVLVGPSGCGKTTALWMMAGLEDVTGGTLRIGDKVVNDLAPRDRDVAMVFQN